MPQGIPLPGIDDIPRRELWGLGIHKPCLGGRILNGVHLVLAGLLIKGTYDDGLP